MQPTYIDPKTKKTVDLSSFGDAGSQNVQANKLGLDIAPTGAITASSLAPATAITIPTKPTPAPIDTTIGQAVIDAQMPATITPPVEPTPAPVKEPGAIESFLSGLKAPGSQTEAYKTAYETAGLPTAEQDILAKQGVVKTAQGKLAAINAQLSAINAAGTAEQLKAAETGTTQRFAAGETARIQRQTAILALPLQAQALAAQAEVQTAQGDVELAQNSMKMASDRLTTLFTMHTKDMENEYNYNKDLRDKVYEFATKKEQAKLDALNKEDERNFQLMRDNINNAQVLSKTALDAGQADLAARITQLDPKSDTYREDLATLQSEIRPDTTDKTYKQLQIEKLRQEIAATGSAQGADENTIAYAQQYAATGKIPAGIPKGTFGVIAQIAKEAPKPAGQIVSRSTGVAPESLGAAGDAYGAAYSAAKLAQQLRDLDKKRVGGVISGTLGKVFGSEDQQRYIDLRSQIVDLLSRARSGAALTVSEERRYGEMLPGRFSEPLGLGTDTQVRIDNFINTLNSDIQNKMDTKGWAMYGLSKVKLGNKEYNVGDTIEINGIQGRVLPDGTIATQ